MKSYVLITDNSESTIQQTLIDLLPLDDDEELIIFDNQSEDNTVPMIVGTINPGVWVSKDNRISFYINNKKISYKETLEKVKTIAKGKIVEIRGEVEDVKN